MIVEDNYLYFLTSAEAYSVNNQNVGEEEGDKEVGGRKEGSDRPSSSWSDFRHCANRPSGLRSLVARSDGRPKLLSFM